MKFIDVFKLQGIQKPALILVTIALLIAANQVLSPISLRLDLSKGKAYTLSPSTKKVLKEVNDVTTIQFFVSSDIPTQLIPRKNDVIDLLNEYKKQGNITIQVLDPKRDTDAARQAQTLGIPELKFSQLEQNKYALTASYFGINVAHKGKNETIPQATDLGSLEYNLTAAVYKLTRKEVPKIAMLGAEDPALTGQDKLSTVKQLLQQQFTLEPISISTASGSTKIDTEYKSLLVFDNGSRQYDATEIAGIKNYINNKGKALFFIDGVSVNNLQATPSQSNVFALLREYGITVNKDLILSLAYEMVMFSNEVVSFPSPYPYWIKTDIVNTTDVNTSNVTQLMYPWVSSLTFDTSKAQVQGLVLTTPQSWQQTKDFTLNPEAIKEPDEKNFKQFTVTAQANIKNGGSVVVFPSSRFIDNDYLQRGNQNLEYVLNIINDFATNGMLSGIRQRAVATYPLPNLKEQEKDIFRYANILILPASFALYGLWRLLKRR